MNIADARCVVVVPTYDEAATIEDFLDAGLAATRDLDADILVVDDSSPDGTGEKVRRHAEFGSRVHLLSRPDKDGLGAAYRAGFAWALERGYDAVVQIDADGSHPADRIAPMVAALAAHDLVIGSRYVPGGATVGWSRHRRLLSWAANAYARILLGLPQRDATAGFRAWRATALVDLCVVESESDGYCFQIENSWRAQRVGLRVIELPIAFTERTGGASKMTGAVAVEALRRVLLWRLREVFGSVGDRLSASHALSPARPARSVRRSRSGQGVHHAA
ncbi:MAG: polyprenol monophosphomannose synthase [Actinomycetota bacterium]|nr:polyprenol monophosphomannose synthase [Actinomycetota bacterium]